MCAPMKKHDDVEHFQGIAETLTVHFCVQNVWTHTAAESTFSNSLNAETETPFLVFESCCETHCLRMLLMMPKKGRSCNALQQSQLLWFGLGCAEPQTKHRATECAHNLVCCGVVWFAPLCKKKTLISSKIQLQSCWHFVLLTLQQQSRHLSHFGLLPCCERKQDFPSSKPFCSNVTQRMPDGHTNASDPWGTLMDLVGLADKEEDNPSGPTILPLMPCFEQNC